MKLSSGERLLIIKHSKEAILTATLQRGFTIYCVPGDDEGGEVLGLITAVFDDPDEPITLTTPLCAGGVIGSGLACSAAAAQLRGLLLRRA